VKFALVNPPWSFDHSIYFGCREPHLPLEYGYAAALLESEGHQVLTIDGQLDNLSSDAISESLHAFGADRVVLTTAPSYLFWRCPPPELRVPLSLLDQLDIEAPVIVVGPHGSTTPGSTLRKLRCDAVVLGECEEVLPRLAADKSQWSGVPGVAWLDGDQVRLNGGLHASNMEALPPLRWDRRTIERHLHHHHRFEASAQGPGAEMETSRGCPYHCTFCAKDNFRNGYRKRPLPVVLAELDGLLAQGVEYVYFIDEIFLPDQELLRAIASRNVLFGVQTRIDLWNPPMLDLLGGAGCVSLEAGMESISEDGRNRLDKRSRLNTDQMTTRLVHARQSIPFVQANLLDSKADAPEAVEAWRQGLIAEGVWANKPVPLFPYPGSPEYARRWGQADDDAWERALDDYLSTFREFSDVQDATPRRLRDLESSHGRTAR
jgi:anaerobic magnesium-protoporphyrin IX monomethyl ester cyclase